MIPIYDFHPAFVKIGPIRATRREIGDIVKSWAAISLAFTILMTSGHGTLDFIVVFLISGLTVGVGFIFHELAHKMMAQRFGCFEEFIANTQMLLFAVFSAFLGFVFAAPGAVYISGPIGRRENGIISAAGPAMNIIIALVFRLLPLGVISSYGANINGWLAFFNLIPVMEFDGSKVWRWNKGIYAVLIVIAAVLAF